MEDEPGGEEPTRSEWEQLRVLTANSQTLIELYTQEAIKRDERIEKTDQAIKDAHHAANRGLVVGALGILAAAIAIVVAVVAVVALNAYKDKIAANRVTGCTQAANGAIVQIKAEKAEWANFGKALIANASAANRERTSIAVDLFLHAPKVGQYDLIDGAHPIRDCTPAGIAAYYDGTGGFLPGPTTTVPTGP